MRLESREIHSSFSGQPRQYFLFVCGGNKVGARSQSSESSAAVVSLAMGVQGLWELLQPVGRTVDLQTMANRRYAVDASIWITQFMKAMRDDEGAAVARLLPRPASAYGAGQH